MRRSERWPNLAPPIPVRASVISSVPQLTARADRVRPRKKPKNRAESAAGILTQLSEGTGVRPLTVAGGFGTLKSFRYEHGQRDDEIGAGTEACRSQPAFVPT